MKMQAILPLVTYPDANSDAVAANAVAIAAYLGADLHAVALNADIPDVSNAMSELLLNLPELIKQTESLSRERGEHLLTKVQRGSCQTIGEPDDGCNVRRARPVRRGCGDRSSLLSTLPCSVGRLATRHREHLRKR